MAANLEPLTAELLAADAAWNDACARFTAASVPGTDRAELQRLFDEKKARQAAYRAARDAFTAAGGNLDSLPA